MQDTPTTSRANLFLAIAAIGFALLLALVWVRFDSASGLTLTVRRRVTIGDALAPTIAAVVIGLGGLLVLLERRAPDQPRLTLDNLWFLTRFLLICAVGFAVMRWAGPSVVWVVNQFGTGDLTCRALRDTAPWKHIGFALGGTGMVAALIASSEGRMTARAVIIAALAIFSLIALFDLPFDDLLPPPNGDL